MGNQICKPSPPQPTPPSTPPAPQPRRNRPGLPESITEILNGADSSIDQLSDDEINEKLHSSGVFLTRKDMEKEITVEKFWVNKKLNCNCFMLYARKLEIAWGHDPDYWMWKVLQESSETKIEVAELIEVCWLEVIRKLDTKKLSPGVMYGVSFHVLLKDTVSYSFRSTPEVNVHLELPGGKVQECQMNVIEMMKQTWMEIPVGQFVAPDHDKGGEMKFSFWELGGNWKEGLLVKGVSIKPL